MALPVIVPRESEEMELCQVIHWHVKKGERVKQGDILCEVDTGKANFDIEAPAEGMVLDIFFHENEEAPLLTPLAVIGEEGEEYEQFRPQTEEAKEDANRFDQTGQSSYQGRTSEGAGIKVTKSEGRESEVARPESSKSEFRRYKGSRPEGKQPVSPRARRFAQRNGIPLQRIQGSGPGGAVVERDVMDWLQGLHQ